MENKTKPNPNTQKDTGRKLWWIIPFIYRLPDVVYMTVTSPCGLETWFQHVCLCHAIFCCFSFTGSCCDSWVEICPLEVNGSSIIWVQGDQDFSLFAFGHFWDTLWNSAAESLCGFFCFLNTVELRIHFIQDFPKTGILKQGVLSHGSHFSACLKLLLAALMETVMLKTIYDTA